MADLGAIRATAERVATSFGLDVVDVEFAGGGKHRVLRVSIEKNAEGRARLLAEAKAAAETGGEAASELPSALVSGELNPEQLSGVTHEDCEVFSRDFGTVIDVEDLVPGAEYTLEVSSPGLDRRLTRPEEYPALLREFGEAADVRAGGGESALAGAAGGRSRRCG